MTETCFCGHDLFSHDEYGPCDNCTCRGWNGCLVIAKGDFGFSLDAPANGGSDG